MPLNIVERFLQVAERVGTRTAVEVEGKSISYTDLRRAAESVAMTFAHLNATPGVPLTAVFAYRSISAYVGVIASLLRGHGYVPLNRTFPVERTRLMLNLSECSELVVDAESAKQLPELLKDFSHRMVIVCPEPIDWRAARREFPQHVFVSGEQLEHGEGWNVPTVAADAIIYLLFTSGSTGKPKGVMVTHANVGHYVEYISERYSITEHDRFSQMFDMTFDLSAADMFVAWSNGACVCCPDAKTVVAPGRFIRDARLTIWFSVPSTGIFMKRLGMLKAGSYPGLRVSMFCGEALPVEVAHGWREAAPNSVVDNLYGPTELTIACCAYRWDGEKSKTESELGCVPIGDPFPDMDVMIADEKLAKVVDGNDGELLMAGPQQAKGYWGDPIRTDRAFVIPPGQMKRFYRTGDRVVRRPGGPLVYLGRVDHQVKILGHRVELGEIEAVGRELSNVAGVVAIPWPQTPAGANGVELFLECERVDTAMLLAGLAKRLPAYMVPRRVHTLTRFPLNVNGKYDRLELKNRLDRGDASGVGT